MSFLIRQYWVSRNIQESFGNKALEVLIERGYQGVLETGKLSEFAQKILFCDSEEIGQIVECHEHCHALVFVLAKSEQRDVLPIGKDMIFYIENFDLHPYQEIISIYEAKSLSRHSAGIEEKSISDFNRLLKTAEGALPPKGRSLNKEYQAVFASYLSWAPVFLGAENSARLAQYISEKARELWSELDLHVFLNRDEAYKFSLQGGHIVDVAQTYLGWREVNAKLSILQAFVLVLHIELLHAYVTDEKKREGIVRGGQFWEDVLDRLVDPVALLSLEGDLLICNHAFSRAGFLPKECLKLKDNETTQKREQYFQVTKKSLYFSDEEHIFILLEQAQPPVNSQLSGKGASEELGIISSSLAHELKNPIAGILAASSLLSYQDNLSEETLGQIKEMQQSAKRCQNLIEIFLGFSKVETPHGHQTSLANALSHAFELLKFRMIETNVRLELREGPHDHRLWDVNPSVASMIFYLILSELITAVAHERLVASQSSDYCVGIQSKFAQDSFSLHVSPAPRSDFKLEGHKLLKHLLEWEALQLIIAEGRVTLLKGGN